jgi:uncharacterized protein YndB with AHSA1/START domain
MTITDQATFPEAGVVRLERVLDAPIERVWEYIATDELRKSWLGGGTIDLEVGGKVHLLYDNSSLTNEPMHDDDTFEPHVEDGTILEVDPPRLLSYTWGEWFGQSCVVTFTLNPVGDRTQLVLTHSRVATIELSLDVARGWHVHLDVLESKFNGTPMPKIWDRFDEVGAYYESMGTAQKA